MSLTLPIVTTEYLYIPVEADIDLESLAVQVCLLPGERIPGEQDWRAATWAPHTFEGLPQARILIGPASPNRYDSGVYTVWLRVLGAPETPVRRSGVVAFTQ